MAYEEEVLAFGALAEELLEVSEGGFGGERGGVKDLGFVAGLGSDEGGCLEAALEGAGDDEVELDIQCIQYVCEVEAVVFAIFIEWAFEVEVGVGAADTRTGVPKDE